MTEDLGWADLELLEKTRAAGTLSGGARALGVDQTTASRHLAALERRVGATPFARRGTIDPSPAARGERRTTPGDGGIGGRPGRDPPGRDR